MADSRHNRLLSDGVSLPNPGSVLSVIPDVAPVEPKAPDWVPVLADTDDGQSTSVLLLMFEMVFVVPVVMPPCPERTCPQAGA